MVLGLDQAASDDVLQEISGVPDIFGVRQARI